MAACLAVDAGFAMIGFQDQIISNHSPKGSKDHQVWRFSLSLIQTQYTFEACSCAMLKACIKHSVYHSPIYIWALYVV